MSTHRDGAVRRFRGETRPIEPHRRAVEEIVVVGKPPWFGLTLGRGFTEVKGSLRFVDGWPQILGANPLPHMFCVDERHVHENMVDTLVPAVAICTSFACARVRALSLAGADRPGSSG